MSAFDFISDAKLRLSYGATGNNRVGSYEYYDLLTYLLSNTYSFNNDPEPPGAITISKLGNQNLKWETTKQLNIGYDLALLKNRIRLEFDFYKKKTTDLLLRADMPSATGYTTAYKNIGSIGNTGVEFTLNTV